MTCFPLCLGTSFQCSQHSGPLSILRSHIKYHLLKRGLSSPMQLKTLKKLSLSYHPHIDYHQKLLFLFYLLIVLHLLPTEIVKVSEEVNFDLFTPVYLMLIPNLT